MQKPHLSLVEALHNPACYDHPVERVELVETHISWVFLAGDFAYKLKKPVDFGFLDFSTLAKRRHFCHEEVRLNRRFAPQLYLDVIRIGGTADTPQLGGCPAFDYLVKMRRFPRQAELDLMLQQQRLTPYQMGQFADYLARIHQQLPIARQPSRFGSPAAICAPMLENFTQLRPLLATSAAEKQLNELESWSQTAFESLRPLLEQRKQQGHIRECHGDVHLANMAWLDERPVLFDCIEFNENFRWIDVLNDIAFLLMDLDDRGAAHLGWHFLNRYLQQTGDYRGLALLNFYKLYRALVRAKVIYLRLAQAGLSDTDREVEIGLAQSYLDLATGYSRPQPPVLLITHGFSGSGKTHFINQFAPQYAAVCIHSDIERKRLYGLNATAGSGSAVDAGIYTEPASQKTYQRLEELATIILKSGFSVIVDATFLKQQQRRRMQQLAIGLDSALIILDFPLEPDELIRRVEQRRRLPEQISEATVAVLQNQLKQAQPLTPQEQQKTIIVHPDSTPAAVARVVQKLQARGRESAVR